MLCLDQTYKDLSYSFNFSNSPVVISSEFRNLTWQVEECVKDIKALCIISLDELVWISFTDLRAE